MTRRACDRRFYDDVTGMPRVYLSPQCLGTAAGNAVEPLPRRGNGPANRLKPTPNAVEIILRRKFVSDSRDRRADVGDVDVQIAATRQVCGHLHYLVVRQPSLEKRQQRYVIGFRDALRVAGPNEPHKTVNQIAQVHVSLPYNVVNGASASSTYSRVA